MQKQARKPPQKNCSLRKIQPIRCQTPDLIHQAPANPRSVCSSSVSPLIKARGSDCVDSSLDNQDSTLISFEQREKPRKQSPLRNSNVQRKSVDLRPGSFSKKQIFTNNWVGGLSSSPALRKDKIKELSTNFRLEKKTLGQAANKENIGDKTDDWQVFLNELESVTKVLPVKHRGPSRKW